MATSAAVNAECRILIVDDEPVFREYLRTSVDWGTYGFTICDEARNGRDAVEKARKSRPDIILADITMPFMDGLQLLEIVHATLPGTAVILLTAHSDFKYARKAVRLGAADYIVKPFDPPDLLDTMLRVKASLQDEKNTRSLLDQTSHFLKSSILNALVRGEDIQGGLANRSYLQALDLKLDSSSYIVASIEMKRSAGGKTPSMSDPRMQDLLKAGVERLGNECGSATVFMDWDGRAIMISGSKGSPSFREIVLKSLECICADVRRHFKGIPWVGVGNTCDHYLEIKKSYAEALAALDASVDSAQGMIVEYGRRAAGITRFYPAKLNEEILIGLRLGHWKDVKAKIDELFEFAEENKLSRNHQMFMCSSLVSVCLSFLVETGKIVEEVFGKGEDPLEDLRLAESTDELKRIVVDSFNRALKSIAGRKATRTAKLARAARVCINQNFKRHDLTVEEIAIRLGISASRLRAIFKKETGKSIIGYLNSVRLRRARELMGTSNLKFSAIAEMVGYSDPGYFCKRFKKHFGLTPSEYENSTGNALEADPP